MTKPSLSPGDTSRQEGAAPKACSLQFAYFLKNRDCFLCPGARVYTALRDKQMHLFPSAPARTDRTQSRVSPCPPAAPAPLPPLPKPPVLCCGRTTLHSKACCRHTVPHKGHQRDRSHSPGPGHSRLSPLPAALSPAALGPRAEAPSTHSPSHCSRAACILSEPI